MPKKAIIWEFKTDIFVSSEIRRMNSNLHISVSEAKLLKIAVFVNTTFSRSFFFPFESVNLHERTQFAQNNIKWNETNRKVVKKRQDISVRWKVSDWVGDLHTKKRTTSSAVQNRSTSWLFSGILLALIVKISYEVKIFIKLRVCITESSAKASISWFS